MSLSLNDRQALDNLRYDVNQLIQDAEELLDDPHSELSYDYRKGIVEDLKRLRDRL